MKKIICLFLILVFCLSLCACYSKGDSVPGDYFIVITVTNVNDMIVYAKDTNVVYYMQYGGDGGYLAPYLIYQDNTIYGAVYQNGEIVPMPFAYN